MLLGQSACAQAVFKCRRFSTIWADEHVAMEQRRWMNESTVSTTSTRRRRTTMQPRVRGDVGEPRASTMCYCGVVARLYTSWTVQNPGRRFFGCKNYQSVSVICRYSLL